MKEERLRVLKVMNEAIGHIDFSEFSNMVSMQPSETMRVLRELSITGHLKKVGGGYGLTEEGKAALKALAPVREGEKFDFYFEIGKPTGISAGSPIEFYEIAKTIGTDSLEFHLYRKDFEKWACNTIENATLAQEFATIEKAELSGEALRSALIKCVESVYNLP